MNIIILILIALVGRAGWAADSAGSVDSDTPERYFRLTEPPFKREDCERFVLGKRGAQYREEIVSWLSQWPRIPLTPVTSHRPITPPETYSPDFAVFAAPAGTPVEDLRRLRQEAVTRYQSWKAAAEEPAPSNLPTHLTKVHRMILGVGAEVARPADALTTTLEPGPKGTFLLRTKDGRKTIGTRALDLAGMRLGYELDPFYWIFSEFISAGGAPSPRHLTVSRYLDEHGVYVLRPTEPTRPEVYFVLRVLAVDGTNYDIQSVEIEVYQARRKDPERIEISELKLPPILDGDGRALQFESVGLKLLSSLK